MHLHEILFQLWCYNSNIVIHILGGTSDEGGQARSERRPTSSRYPDQITLKVANFNEIELVYVVRH